MVSIAVFLYSIVDILPFKFLILHKHKLREESKEGTGAPFNSGIIFMMERTDNKVKMENRWAIHSK